MAVYSKLIFSGSTNGLGILVAATGTPGTTIHDTSTILDEIWAWAMNNSASDVVLSIEFGGVTNPKDVIEQTIPSDGGLILVVPGLILTGSVDMDAFAATTNVISMFGYVNRIT